MATLAEIDAEIAKRERLAAIDAEIAKREGGAISQSETSILDSAVGAAENIGSIASGIIAEPVAGVSGIVQSLNPFADEGAGASAVNTVRDMLTYQPKTEEGKEQQKNIGEFLRPVGEALSITESFLGDNVLELTGSPVLATAAHSLPTAALELIGIKGSKNLRTPKDVTTKEINKALLESAPEVETIQNAARGVYNEITDAGVMVKSDTVDNLLTSIEKKAKKNGLDPRLTDKTARAMKIMNESKGIDQPLTELDALRKIASETTKSLDGTEKAIGNLMLNEIDEFMDNITPSQLVGGSQSKADVGKKYKAARKLWGRAKRAEMIEEAIVRGSDQAAGAEAGIRNEFNRLLRNKTSKKYLPEADQQLMRDVVQGDFKTNFTRAIGKLGLSVDRSPNVFQSIVAGGGLGYGLGGSTGALLVPIAGTASKAIAQKLTKNKAKFTKDMIAAGKDGTEITRAYLRSVPKNKRSANELSNLLADPSIDLNTIKMIGNETFKDALEMAKGKRAIDLAIGAGVGSLSNQGQQENQ